ncbi:hypothetical protein GRX03_06510 [Halovenus sp. WSH3]|uniref:DUF4157 domain-containing protein n=1 Tax=Halovenus carboxidivorans TaxID=2692199 RepID=A0A6B0T0A9_9EURY|nr:hypothetical protein [Halovenus carboxidivorans]MXR51255.1 hypothetical protein [Halovenus carboxidivorans]
MSTRRVLAVLVVAVALVLGGCQAPGVTQTPSASEPAPGGADNGTGDPFPITDPANITVEGAHLRTDPGLVYERLEVLLGTDQPSPERIRAFNSSDEFADSAPGSGLGAGQPRFFDVIGFETGSVSGKRFIERVGNGYTLSAGSVVVYAQPNATRDEEEMLLAHELTHYIQFQNSRRAQLAEAVGSQTVDGRYVVRSLIEGAAVYTTDEYLRQFGENGTLNSPYYDEEQRLYPPGHIGRWANSRYQIGSQYVTQRLDDPSETPEIYSDPPTTSRRLFDPDAPPRPSLSVTNTLDRDVISTNRLGMAFVRYGLESHVDPDRARSVADGFGTDALRQFRSDRDTYANYAWVTRWESEAAADEFASAVGAYFDARGNRTADGWSLTDPDLTVQRRRATADTVVLLFGSASFVSGVDASGSGGEVTLTPTGG